MSCKVSGVNLPLVWLDSTWAKSSRIKCRILSCFSLLSLALRFLIVLLKMALHVCCRFTGLTWHTHTHRGVHTYISYALLSFLRTFIDIIMYEPSPTLIPIYPKFKTKSSPSNSPLQLWGPGLTQMISWEIISASFCYSTPRKNHPNELQPVWLSGPKSMPIIASNLYFSQL